MKNIFKFKPGNFSRFNPETPPKFGNQKRFNHTESEHSTKGEKKSKKEKTYKQQEEMKREYKIDVNNIPYIRTAPVEVNVGSTDLWMLGGIGACVLVLSAVAQDRSEKNKEKMLLQKIKAGEYGPDTPFGKGTLLQYAAEKENFILVDALLEKKSDVPGSEVKQPSLQEGQKGKSV